MTNDHFMAELAAMMEVDVSEFTPETRLENLPTWDSLAVISFMAFVDEHFGFAIGGDAIHNAKTVADLMALAGEGLQSTSQAA